MASGPTYYDFFGVSRTASAEQIRSAYLWLMKQYHPDLADESDRERAIDYAAVLNRSYDVLKDPQKRANYDAWLDLDSASRGKRKAQRVLLTGSIRRKRESWWDASSKGAAALAAVVLLLLGAAVTIPGSMHVDSAGAATGDSGAAQRQASHVDDTGIREQVRAAIATRSEDAESASDRCFAAARADARLDHAERCIVFDDAYLEWNQSAADVLSRPLYFNDAVVRLRHRNALAASGEFQEARLIDLRQRTLNALLAEIGSKVVSNGGSAGAAAK